jgi:hypothetical protein
VPQKRCLLHSEEARPLLSVRPCSCFPYNPCKTCCCVFFCFFCSRCRRLSQVTTDDPPLTVPLTRNKHEWGVSTGQSSLVSTFNVGASSTSSPPLRQGTRPLLHAAPPWMRSRFAPIGPSSPPYQAFGSFFFLFFFRFFSFPFFLFFPFPFLSLFSLVFSRPRSVC